MLAQIGWIVAAVVGVIFVSLVVARVRSDRRRRRRLSDALHNFQLRREWLEASFVSLAQESAPRGLEWSDCEFDDRVRFARDPEKNELCAFVGITIKFEAIEGGPMEEVEAVANHKAATAVFHFRDDKWVTLGRVIFNLNPHETIMRYQLEHVE